MFVAYVCVCEWVSPSPTSLASSSIFKDTFAPNKQKHTNDYGDVMESKMTTLMLFCVIFVLAVCLFMPSKNMDMRQHQHIGDKNGENEMKRCDMNGVWTAAATTEADTMFRDLTGTSCTTDVCVDSHEKQTFKMRSRHHTHALTHTCIGTGRTMAWKIVWFENRFGWADAEMSSSFAVRSFFVRGKCRHGN